MREKKTLNVAIGSRVQKYREKNNMTQERLAELLNYSTNHLSALERGTSSFPVEKLVDVCRILNVSADRLLFDDHSTGVAAPIISRIEELAPRQVLFVERFLDLYISSVEKE